ncbi:MAG: hypothetical protein ABR538_09670 [Candidatus Binatia bacterium]
MDWLFTYADPTIDWNYAMITLVVRFIGVFVVMAVVQIAMQTASKGIRIVETRAAQKAAGGAPAVAAPMMSLDISAIADGDAILDGRTVAAIGLALSMEAEQKTAAARRLSAASHPSGARASAWGLSARLRGLR